MEQRPAVPDTSAPGLAPGDQRGWSWFRVVAAGALMGWANLVPGVSGGTMLLVCGVYPDFVVAVSELTRMRWRGGAPLWMAVLTAGVVVAVLTSAGLIKNLVEARPVAMYSLFAGLTLGGVPLVLRRTIPARAPVWIAGGLSFAAMTALAFVDRGADTAGGPLPLFAAGVVGASAMVLPGLSGSYLLLLMGQYVPILGAIESFRNAVLDPLLRGHAIEASSALEAAGVLAPFALGVGTGVVVVSQLVRIALKRAPATTYGLLLGLLLGAVPGLWPFPGAPTVAETGLALTCLGAGFSLTWGLSRFEREETAPQIWE